MNSLEKEFVPYQESLELKELGFNEPCIGRYNILGEFILSGCYSDSPLVSILVEQNDICEAHTLAPTFSQAFRWFRTIHDLHGCIDLHASNPSHWYIRIDKVSINDYIYHSEDENLMFSTYEEAELACLRELIRVVKNKF